MHERLGGRLTIGLSFAPFLAAIFGVLEEGTGVVDLLIVLSVPVELDLAFSVLVSEF